MIKEVNGRREGCHIRHSGRVAGERARTWLQQEGHRVLISRDSVHDDGLLTYAFDREAQALLQAVSRVLDGDVQLELRQAPGGCFLFDEGLKETPVLPWRESGP